MLIQKDEDVSSMLVILHQTSQPFIPDLPQTTNAAYSMQSRTHYSVVPISIDPHMYAVIPFVHRVPRLSIASSFSTVCLSSEVHSPCISEDKELCLDDVEVPCCSCFGIFK